MKKNIEPAIARLHTEIKNIEEFFDDNELRKILKKMEDVDLKDIDDAFVEYVDENIKQIRRCSWCGRLMVEGYWLDDEYACSDDCRNEIYKWNNNIEDDKEAEKLYLRDYFQLDDEDIEGLTAEEICEKYKDYEGADTVMWTQWE